MVESVLGCEELLGGGLRSLWRESAEQLLHFHNGADVFHALRFLAEAHESVLIWEEASLQ